MPQIVNNPQDVANTQQQVLDLLGKLFPQNNQSGGFNNSNIANKNPGVTTETPNDPNEILKQMVKNNPITKATYKAIEDHTTDAVNHAISVGMPYADIINSAHQQAGIPNPTNMGGATGSWDTAQTQPPPVNNPPPAQADPTATPNPGYNVPPPAQSIPVTSPKGRSNTQTGTFEFDKPANTFEQVFGRPQVYQDEKGIIHYKPGGLFGAGANDEALTQAQALQKLSGKEQIQPQQLLSFGAQRAQLMFDMSKNTNESAKGYREAYDKIATDTGWNKIVNDGQTIASITPQTKNPLEQQKIMEAVTGVPLAELLKNPDAVKGLQGSFGNRITQQLQKLNKGEAALTPQQIANGIKLFNNKYQSSKIQFALASSGFAQQIQADNQRRPQGFQVNPSDAMRPIDIIKNQPQNQQNNDSGFISTPGGNKFKRL